MLPTDTSAGRPKPHSHRDPGPTPTRPRGCVRPLFGLDLPWCAPVGRLGRLGRAQPTLVARRGGACAAAGERGQGGRRRLSCRRCRRRRRRPAARWPGPARRAPGRAAASAWTAWRPAAACERRTEQRTSSVRVTVGHDDGRRRAAGRECSAGSTSSWQSCVEQQEQQQALRSGLSDEEDERATSRHSRRGCSQQLFTARAARADRHQAA